ncbi:MAG: hypothetical protein WCW56_00165 [Candidatus Paceibacterota bacterium]|jgi:hypothetical protein
MDGQNNEGQGPMIGVVLIMAILIVGGVYMLFTRLNQNPQSAPTSGPNATTGEVNIEGTSTDVNSIEADAAKVNTNSLDSDLANFDQTVGQ